MATTSDDAVDEALSMDRIAVVGCSTTPGKAAHDIPEYLIEEGYEVIPVNPTADEVLGREAYDSLSEVEETVDVVDVFRPSDEVGGIVEEALERDDVQVVWTQLGIQNEAAADRARDGGLSVVQDRCMKVEHQARKGE